MLIAKSTITFALLALSAVACAGEVVEMGGNRYSVSKTSFGCGFGNPANVKNSLYKQASGFCRARSLTSEVINVQQVDGVVGRRCANASVEFRCVSAEAVSTSPTSREPDRDMNHGIGVAADRGQFGARNERPAASSIERYDALAKLKSLLDSGAISQAEYEAEKRKLLSR